MTTSVEPRSAPGSYVRVLACSGLDGKPTRAPDWNIVLASFFLAERALHFVRVPHARSFSSPSRLFGFLAGQPYADRTRSVYLRLLRNGTNTTESLLPRKLYGFNDLARGVGARVLTRGHSEGYTALVGSRSKCEALGSEGKWLRPRTPDYEWRGLRF